jgi:hypothetical protein
MDTFKFLNAPDLKVDSIEHDFIPSYTKTKRLKELERTFKKFSAKIVINQNSGFKIKEIIECENIFVWFENAGLVNNAGEYKRKELEIDIEWCFDRLGRRSNDRYLDI